MYINVCLFNIYIYIYVYLSIHIYCKTTLSSVPIIYLTLLISMLYS